MQCKLWQTRKLTWATLLHISSTVQSDSPSLGFSPQTRISSGIANIFILISICWQMLSYWEEILSYKDISTTNINKIPIWRWEILKNDNTRWQMSISSGHAVLPLALLLCPFRWWYFYSENRPALILGSCQICSWRISAVITLFFICTDSSFSTPYFIINLIRGASKGRKLSKLGFWPNQLSPPPPPCVLGHHRMKNKYLVYFGF